ncbi:MAG: hypothetical protein ACKPKO_32235, partial [Candidatus Fonsibacter sp.]
MNQFVYLPGYMLFSEDEKNEMRKYNGPLPEEQCFEEKMMVSEELPRLALAPAVPRLRRRPGRIIPMPALEPHGEDEVPVMEETTKECLDEKYLEEAKLR